MCPYPTSKVSNGAAIELEDAKADGTDVRDSGEQSYTIDIIIPKLKVRQLTFRHTQRHALHKKERKINIISSSQIQYSSVHINNTELLFSSQPEACLKRSFDSGRRKDPQTNHPSFLFVFYGFGNSMAVLYAGA
ncbi:hypothetical protein MG293_000420 [Ovis ammon polii]|uniref:Uncharacterized protein n=1 Tax=Ovis ammon polii TaxID=230172 RepID=A0AAD4UQG0_OVIAM|nr:hypothetical protein MG293_000420 [Ovis ammon polii]